MLCQSEARSQELLLGIPHGCRVPRLWAVHVCPPRPQAGSWMGSRAARIRTGARMGSQRTLKVRTLTLGLGKQLRTTQRLGNLHPHGEQQSSWLLASDGLSSGYCSFLGSESMARRPSCLSLLSVCLTFQ